MAEPVYNTIKEEEPIQSASPEVATGGAIIAPSGVPFKGNAAVIPSKFSQSGINQLSVGVGDSIQDAITAMYKAGGGKVFLSSGTHLVNTALIGYTGVDLEGENQSTTIIDFNNTSANLSFIGTDVYSTGTITSINSGVNVTGSGTSWLANVTTNHQLFVGNTWYKIAVVLTDTTLTLGEGYQGNATLPGATYRAAKIIRDVDIKDILFKNSTGTAIEVTDCRNFTFKSIQLSSNNKGFVFTNTSEFNTDRVLALSNTSNGGEVVNARITNIAQTVTSSNGGHGLVLNNVETSVVRECSANSNTSDGYNITSCSTIPMSPIEASANGGQGVECVSGNDNIVIDGVFNSNTSDGIKFTATTDNSHVGNSRITNNGGNGINIAASTCDNNLIHNNVLASSNSHSLDLEDGSSQYAEITDGSQTGLDLTGDFTMECWIKPESLPTAGNQVALVAKWSNASPGYMFRIDNNAGTYRVEVDTRLSGVTDQLYVNYAFSIATWYHVAVVFTASTATFELFINGTSQGSSAAGANTSIDNSSANFVVGARYAVGIINLFDGLIDDVRVWSDKRTSTEISQKYNKEIVVNYESNLVGYWKFNNSYLDETVNNNDLTSSGSPVFSTTVGMASAVSNSGTGTLIRSNIGVADN